MKIIYWSSTGNTEAMANLISKGIEEVGKKAELLNISESSVGSLENENLIVLGCPAMGNEELEEGEFIPFLDTIKEDLSGKKVILFGSYGWGDCQWIRDWQDEMESLGAKIELEPLCVNYTPEGDSEEECIEYGRKIAKLEK